MVAKKKIDLLGLVQQLLMLKEIFVRIL